MAGRGVSGLALVAVVVASVMLSPVVRAGQLRDQCPHGMTEQELCQAMDERLKHIDKAIHKACPKKFPWKYGTKCFRFSLEEVKCEDAAKACEDLNGFLAEPRDHDTMEYIRAVAKLHPEVQGYWLGGSSYLKPGYWSWRSDNETFSYTAWGEHSPATLPHRPQESESCLESRHGADYLWNDRNAKKPNNYICETAIPSERR